MFLVLLMTSVLCGVSAVDLRVACRLGQPPMNDAASKTATKCEGMMAAVFYAVTSNLNISFTMDMLDKSDIDTYLIVNKTTNTSLYDVVITYHTVTPERMELYDFSVAVTQSTDSVALNPTFFKSIPDLVAQIIRDSVMYIFALVSTSICVMSTIVFVFESLSLSDSGMNDVTPWRRPLWALEMGYEIVFTWTASERLSHQVSRSLRVVIAIAGLFLLTILGSVITSQLTATSLSSTDTAIGELRGERVAIASSTLKPFLEGLNIGAVTTQVDNINLFANEWYAGKHSEYAGYSTATEIVNYLGTVSGGIDNQFTTVEYKASGAFSLKAIPFSKIVQPSIKGRFDIELQRMREVGDLAALQSKYIDLYTVPKGGAKDIPIDSDTQMGLIIASAGFYGIVVIAAVVSFFVMKPSEGKKVEKGRKLSSEQNLLEFKGQTYTVGNSDLCGLLDYICERASKTSPLDGAEGESVLEAPKQHNDV